MKRTHVHTYTAYTGMTIVVIEQFALRMTFTFKNRHDAAVLLNALRKRVRTA